MKMDFEKIVKKLKGIATNNPLVFAAASIVIVMMLVFWNLVFSVVRAFLFAAIAMALIVILIGIWLKVKHRRPALKELFSEKKGLLAKIRLAEKKYMKRKLSEKDFNKIFKDSQKRLIHVEALIDQAYYKEKKELDKELLSVQTKKRHILKSLLDEKRQLVKEMNITEKRYLRRKLDAKTYLDLVQKNQELLVELEARIKVLYDEANISKVMENLKARLSEIDKNRKKKSTRKTVSEKEQLLQIAKEITEQVSRK